MNTKDFLRKFVFFISENKKGTILVGIIVILLAIIVVGQIGTTGSILPGYSLNKMVAYGFDGSTGRQAVFKGGTESDMAYSEGGVVSGVSIISPIPSIPAASTPDLPKNRKVIQNGSLGLLVKNADDSVKEITGIAEANDGFAENVSLYEVSDGVKSGLVTIRVPSKNFTMVMEAVKELAVKVNNENVYSDDVTAQYVDLEAQIKNYKVEEAQYREIMNRAVKIQDVLDVASRLADVRGRIERAQGQLNYLARQVAMSTISISLTAEPEVKVFGIVWRPLTVLKQSFKSLLTDLTGFVDWLVKFIFKIPIYILRLAFTVLVIWVIWIVIVWFKKKIWR